MRTSHPEVFTSRSFAFFLTHSIPGMGEKMYCYFSDWCYYLWCPSSVQMQCSFLWNSGIPLFNFVEFFFSFRLQLLGMLKIIIIKKSAIASHESGKKYTQMYEGLNAQPQYIEENLPFWQLNEEPLNFIMSCRYCTNEVNALSRFLNT